MSEAFERVSTGLQSEKAAKRLAGLFIVMGILHFLVPRPFDDIVPRVLGSPRKWTYLSGIAELASGIFIAMPRHRRTGGLFALAVILGVYPANWQMALDAGMPPTSGLGWGAWLRLPFQIPLMAWAWGVMAGASNGSAGVLNPKS